MGLREWVVGRPGGFRDRIRKRLSKWLGRSAPVAAPPPKPKEGTEEAGWVLALAQDQAPKLGEVVEVAVQGETIAVAHTASGLVAVDGVCPHAGGPLGDGTVEGNALVCPWHGWSYDLSDGRCLVNPEFKIRTHEVRTDARGTWIRLAP